MQTRRLLRASIGTGTRKATPYRTSLTRVSVGIHRWLAISAALLGCVGCRAVRDLLNAIPDSNDDFGLF